MPASSPKVPVERRKRRSRDTLTALSRLLESISDRSGRPTLALADPSGLLVAGAGAFSSCEELAALAPCLNAKSAVNDVIPSRLDVLRARAEVRRLSVDGVEVLLCTDRRLRSRFMDEAADGCRRILGRIAPH
jgi:hypothetical protein